MPGKVLNFEPERPVQLHWKVFLTNFKSACTRIFARTSDEADTTELL